MRIACLNLWLFFMLAMMPVATAVADETFIVSEDAFVSSQYPTKTSPYNNPAGKYLWSGYSPAGDNAYTFMKFDTGKNWIWPESYLNVYCNSNVPSSTASVTTKVWYLSNDTWDSNSITYNTMPDFSAAPVLAEKSITGTGWISFDTSGLAALEAGQTVSLVLGSAYTPNDTYKCYFENLEYTGMNEAKLTAVAAAPEPVSLVLFLAGGGVVGVARRMKKKKGSIFPEKSLI